MKQIKLNSLFIAFVFLVVLASCHKDKIIPKTDTPTAERAGLYVLNQGSAPGDNNSTLTFYNYSTKQLFPDFYSSVNGSPLGDTGNDVEIYGSKMYIVMNVSSVVDVVNAKTGKLIKQDSLLISKGVGREPRSVAFYENNAFITSYDGTVAVMDTTTLTISKYITVGRNPEQLVVANNKLYVANSGGLDYANNNYDKTVSVIDLTTLTVIKTLTVVINPQNIVADNNGNVYVLSAGNYGNTPPSLAIIDDKADVVTSQSNFDGSNMAIQGDNIYFISSTGKIIVYSAKTHAITSPGFISDGTVITTPYSVAGDSTTGEVFVTDAKDYSSNGTLYAFDKTGKKEYAITVGINPGKVALVNK